MNIERNELSGPIPSSLSGLGALQVFFAGENRLSGAVPAAPGNLIAARLCPNPLDTVAGPNDPEWDAATGSSPWWATPFAGNQCDEIFHDDFEF
jgi:hypothetical protein